MITNLPEKMKFSVLVTYDDYIVRDHQLHQVRAVPGVTFLDLIYRFLQMRGYEPQDFEVRNLIFKRPVTPTQKHIQKVVVEFLKKGTGYHFIGRCVSLEDGKECEEWIENLTGELMPVERVAEKHLDAEKLIQQASRKIDIDYVYSHSRKSGLYHYDFMKLLGNVYNGEGYALADVTISELAKQYLSSFYLHPAFLDGALAVPGASILPNVEIDYGKVKPFIPLYITSFRAYHALEEGCYIYIDEDKIELAASQDLMYFDVEIYNKNGVLAAKYTRFAAKQVRSEERVKEMVTDIDHPELAEQNHKIMVSNVSQHTVKSNLKHQEGVINFKEALKEKQNEQEVKHEKVNEEEKAPQSMVADSEWVKNTILNEIAGFLKVDAKELDAQKEFYDFGLESKDILGLVERLQEIFKVELYPTLLFEYTNTDSLTEYLVNECHVGGTEEKTDMGDMIAALISEKLGIPVEEIDREKEFYDFGLESKDLLDLVEKLQQLTNMELYPTILFEYTNINALAGYMDSENISLSEADVTEKKEEKKNNEISGNDDESDFTYYTLWEPAKKQAKDSEKVPKSILVVTSLEGRKLAEAIVKESKVSEENAFTIVLGKENKTAGERIFEVNAEDKSAMTDVLKQISEIHSVYFLGGVQDINDCDNYQYILNNYQVKRNDSIIAFFRLIKCFFHAGKFRSVQQIKVVVNQIWNVTGSDRILPYAAGLSGFTKSLSKEYIKKEVLFIDIDYSVDDNAAQTKEKAELILRESSEQKEVAFRNNVRYQRKIQKCNFQKSDTILLRENGVYVLFGGTGGIGMETAKHLVRDYHARIVLVNRKELTDEQKEKISEIEKLGGTVSHMIADLTKPEEIKSVITAVKNTYGKIHGVFHSAIVLKDKPVKTMDEELLCQVLEPKDLGTVAIFKAIAEEDLDFMVFYSSAESYMGSFGQANYAAACSAKDALAMSFNQNVKYPVYVINWGYWGSVGIVAKEKYRDNINASGILSIEVEEGMHVLDMTLSHNANHVLAIKFSDELEKAILPDAEEKGIVLPINQNSCMIKVWENIQKDVDNETVFQDNYDKEAWERFGKLCNGLVLDAFWRMGVFQHAGETYTVNELFGKLGIIEEYRKMYIALLDILSRAGFLTVKEEKITVSGLVDDKAMRDSLANIKSELNFMKENYPQLEAYCNLLGRCTDSYPDVLTGKRKYMSVMFPKGSFELVEKIYAGNVITDYYNRLVARIVKEYVAEKVKEDANVVVNILEAGAGTGGTSIFVAEALKPYAKNIHYFYTDVSIEFTRYQDKAFCDEYPFIKFGEFDLEKDVRMQGYELGKMDVVFASNVLHATANISTTMLHLKQMLKQKGLFIVNEATRRNDVVTMIFGLTNGWWAYQDTELRIPYTPLLDVDTWKHVFSLCGYDDIWTAQLPAGEGTDAGQSVIIAESNGYLSEREYFSAGQMK